ncbi:hypothetical protein Tco_0766011 [Tanacetum coccineum]
MCPELMPTESKKIRKYIRGFPEGIKGNITSSKPATLHEAINMARALVEQSVQGIRRYFLQHLDSNQAMLESEAEMTYHAYATGEKTPKPKSTKKKVDSESSSKTKLTQASKGKRIKTVAKGDKPARRSICNRSRKGFNSDIAVSFGSGADELTGSIPGVPDVPTYKSDDEQISWKSSKEDDDDEQTNLDNDGDDFVHPKLSTHDDEARQDDEVNEEESDDESNEDSDEEVQGANIEEKEMDEDT